MQVRGATSKAGTHHLTYELALPDGRILRTRISHPPNRATYGADIWRHILRDQLDVTEDEFWTCVHSGQPPHRSGPAAPKAGVPAVLVYQLVAKFRVPEAEVARMSKQEVIERLHELWSQEGS